MTTNIEWTDETWNPTRGCKPVSPGCLNCYAQRSAIRQVNAGYAGLVQIGKRGPQWTGEGRFIEDALDLPLRWRRPRRVFVDSMSDLFFEKFTNEEIAAVFAVMALAPRHTFQVLTKRPARAREWFAWAEAEWPKLHSLTAIQEMRARGHGPDSNVVLTYARGERVLEELRRVEDDFAAPWPLPNVHLGVSVENQAAADERIPLLLQTPAAVRFLSVEPLLGPVDLSRWLAVVCSCARCGAESDGLHDFCPECKTDNLVTLWGARQLERMRTGERYENGVQPDDDGPGLDWVIVGGESGPGARPCDVAWIRSIVEQCRAADVACFVKQLGAASIVSSQAQFSMLAPIGDPTRWGRIEIPMVLKDRKGGDPAEWPEDLRVRQFPEAP